MFMDEARIGFETVLLSVHVGANGDSASAELSNEQRKLIEDLVYSRLNSTDEAGVWNLIQSNLLARSFYVSVSSKKVREENESRYGSQGSDNSTSG